jgi:hypothetical protein
VDDGADGDDTAILGVDAIEIPGVDGDEHNSPQPLLDDHDTTEVEIIDLDIETEEEAEPEGPRIEVEAPDVPIQEQPIEVPEEATGVRRSTWVKLPKQDYVPSMTGSKYAYAVIQMECHRALNPDSHMFFQEDMYQAEPDVVALILTQLSLKAGLEHWGDKGKAAVRSEMKQLQFRDTFKPLQWNQMTHTQKQSVLEPICSLKKRGTVRLRVEQ